MNTIEGRRWLRAQDASRNAEVGVWHPGDERLSPLPGNRTGCAHCAGVRAMVGAENYADVVWKGREIEQAVRNDARARSWERDRLREVSP